MRVSPDTRADSLNPAAPFGICIQPRRDACTCIDVFGSKAVLGQTLSMNNLSVSPIVYAELPSEARMLLSIFAQAAAARYVAQPLKKSELIPILESIWNRNRLCLSDLANPFRMTALLETELSSVCFVGGV